MFISLGGQSVKVTISQAPEARNVRLRARTVKEVKVLFRHTFSGLKPKETASPQGGVGSNWR